MKDTPNKLTQHPAPYGLCPKCGDVGVTRERRPDGFDTCGNKHRYRSRKAIGVVPHVCPLCRKETFPMIRRTLVQTAAADGNGKVIAPSIEPATQFFCCCMECGKKDTVTVAPERDSLT